MTTKQDTPSAYVADLAQRIAEKLTNYVYQPLHESRAAEIIRAEIQAYRTEMEAEHCVDPATWTVTRPEPKEPEVVALDDPTVPYSLVPLGGASGAGAVAGPPDSVTLDWLAVVGKLNTKIRELEAELDRVRAAAAPQPQPANGDTSDGFHTFNELYDYRKAFNALLFNEWAARGRYDVHKSRQHSDGEPCFGGGWFIVVAETPWGQISNHYKDNDWELFAVPERERGNVYDGHTPQVALQRMLQLAHGAVPASPWQPIATDDPFRGELSIYRNDEFVMGINAPFVEVVLDAIRAALPPAFSEQGEE